MRAWILLPALAGLSLTALADEPARLQEVVVTATLRHMPEEKVPASVTVLDTKTITEAGVQHLEELLPQIPSLSWAGASSRPRYFQLRGIGELEQYQGAPNPSVGFLVDDIDFSGIGMLATLFDVDQVEVLRGPQGTRYGANALAGLIKIKTRDPVPVPELMAETTVGSDAMVGARAVAGGPLGGDGSAWRLVAQRTTSDGFRYNAYLHRHDTNGRDELTTRGRLRLILPAAWRLDLTLLHADLDNGYDAFAIDNSFTTLSDRPGRDTERSTGLSADLRHEGDGVEFRSISAWAHSNLLSSYDGDWGNEQSWGIYGPYDFFSSNLRQRSMLSQDLRLTSTGDAPLSWVAGAYLLRLIEDNAEHDDGLYLTDYSQTFLHSSYSATSAALYGELDWALSAVDTVSAGLRLEQREARYSDSNALAFAPLDRMWGGRLSYVHQFDRSLNGWVDLSRGFKAGGFNIGTAVPADRAQFHPEYLWSLEAGLKGRWDEQRLAADVSVYLMHREHQQVSTSYQADPQDPLTFVYLTDNAARGRAYGLEASGQWQATERWALSAMLSLESSEYIGYQYGDRSLDGRAWADAPAWKYSLAASWHHPRGWMARIDVGGQDSFYFDTSHDKRSRPYSLVNLRGGYDAASWSVELWLHNVFDKRYPVRGFYFGDEPPDFPNKLYLRLGDPRQGGLTATYRF